MKILVSVLVLFSPLLAEEVTWTGSGGSNWSTPSSWSSGSVPGVDDEVIIDGNIECSLDLNVEIASLTVAPTYSNTLSLGSYTMKINQGNFDGIGDGEGSGPVNAGTSTIEFTGSIDQEFLYSYHAVYHTVFNNKASGALKYRSWMIVNVDTLKGSAGTVTELSRVSRIYVNNIEVIGSPENKAKLRSGAAGERIIIHLLNGDNNIIADTEIRDVWADSPYGIILDASDVCSDDGNNKGISFKYPVSYYDGGAADDFYSSVENWSNDELPGSDSLLFFSNLVSDKSLIVNQDISIAGIEVVNWNYYPGTIDLGQNTITFTGDLDFGLGSTPNTTQANLVMNGEGDQFIIAPGPLTFSSINVSGSDRFIEFQEDITAATFTANDGVEIRFGAGKTYQFDNFNISGDHDNIIHLRPATDIAGTMNTPWFLNVSNSATVEYASILNSDASGGVQVVANTSIDQGQNLNWSFTGAPPTTSDSFIEFPSTSAVSPAFTEGHYYWNPSSVSGEAHGGQVNGQIISESGIFINFPLDPTGVATPVSVEFNGDSSTEKTGTITWTPTDLGSNGSITIRKGDSLLFTFNDGQSSNFQIDEDGDGVYSALYSVGSLVPTIFDEAGSYAVSVIADPNGSTGGQTIYEEVAIYNVTVVDVDLRAPIAVEIGHERGKNIVISPVSEIGNIEFSSSDDKVVEVRLHEQRSDGVRLSLTGKRRGTSSLIAKLPNGQIISALELDEFSLEFGALNGLIVDGNAEEATSRVIMRPYVSNIDFELRMFSSETTFEGGETDIEFNSDEFELVEENGEIVGKYAYIMEIPDPENVPHTCHGVDLFQGEDDMEEINTKSVNVLHCTAYADELMICIEEGGNSGKLKARVTGDSSPYSGSSSTKRVEFRLIRADDDKEFLGRILCRRNQTRDNGDGWTIEMDENQEPKKFDVEVKFRGEDSTERIIDDVVIAFSVEIKRDEAGGGVSYESITDANKKVLPGQKMNLKAEVKPDGLNATLFEWTIQGEKFKDYVANQTTGTLTEMEGADFFNETIHYYWKDTGDNREAKCEVIINGEACVGKANFDVKKPTSSFTTTLGTAKLNMSGTRIGLFPDADSLRGIVYTGQVTVPEGFDEGKWNWVQLVTASRFRTLVDAANTRQRIEANGTQYLDTTYPYGPAPFTAHPGTAGAYDTGNTSRSNNDTPSSGLTFLDQKKSIENEQFIMYLMFLPPGEDSRYVPLKSVNWSFSIGATFGPAGWTIDENSAQQSVSSAVDTTTHPTWTDNITNHRTWVNVTP